MSPADPKLHEDIAKDRAKREGPFVRACLVALCPLMADTQHPISDDRVRDTINRALELCRELAPAPPFMARG